MNFLQAVKLAMVTIWSNKLRSFLTMLGVIIGVFAVVALIALGQGATETVNEQIQGMGANLISVQIRGRGTKTSLTLAEVRELEDKAGVSLAAPVISAPGQIRHGLRTAAFSVEGATPEYQWVRNHPVQAGRFLVPADIVYRQRVALLGTEAAAELFPAADPLGNEISINGTPFTVVGVLEEKGTSGMMGGEDNKVIIPVSTAMRLFQRPGVEQVFIQADSPQSVDRAVAALEASLKYRFRGDEEAYTVFDQAQILDLVNQVMGTMTLMLGGIAGISLLVGGIGIMNIMLVSVTERTREIGLCKALGAKKRDVLFQFLVESAVISGLGGLVGLLFGFGLLRLLGTLIELPSVFSVQVVLFALFFSLLVGLFFGIYPANKAAKLNPIDALRAE